MSAFLLLFLAASVFSLVSAGPVVEKTTNSLRRDLVDLYQDKHLQSSTSSLCSTACPNGDWVTTDSFYSNEAHYVVSSVQECINTCKNLPGYTMAAMATSVENSCSSSSYDCYCELGATSAAQVAATEDSTSWYVCFVDTIDTTMCGATCTNGNWVVTDSFAPGEYGSSFVSVQDCVDKCYSYEGYTMANVAVESCTGGYSTYLLGCYCQKGASSAADLAANADTSEPWVTCYTGTDDSVPVPVEEVSDALCFAATETLLLDSGSKVAMDQVKVGDRVQIASATDGSLSYAEVIFLPHTRNSQLATFIKIETASGASLKATPPHLVVAGTCGANNMQLTRAEDVSVGECMDTASGEDVITASIRSQGQGVYSVITSHPDDILIVNGLKASSFAVSHFIGNSYYHIHRMLYAYTSCDVIDLIFSGLTTALEHASNQVLSLTS